MNISLSSIRNFCIIAHIDHGKSTLADRMLQLTHSVDIRVFRDQMLDSMDLERERGITIKSHPVTMRYHGPDKRLYEFNLLDTPGHVDFTYEVSRSMAACEGALLVVDATQGVQAQTVANVLLALESNLVIIPVLNKIDMPTADVEKTSRQIEDVIGISMSESASVSAKTGCGVPELMDMIVSLIPPPACKTGEDITRALIFDSVYDSYKGVIPYVRVVDGEFKAGDRIRFMGTGCHSEVKEVGVFLPTLTPLAKLKPGQVGYVICTIKDPDNIKVGDTITALDHPSREPLPGFKPIQPMVFSGLYPADAANYEKLHASLERLRLNDSAFTCQIESSTALGFGFRCGFLGLLHMEIVQERLRREYDVDIISTHPSVVFRVHLKNGEVVSIDNPAHFPDSTRIDFTEEPMLNALIMCPNEYISEVMKLVMDRRGKVEKTESLDSSRVMLTCGLPLNEILVDFHDHLKSVTRGYSSMDYEHRGYAASDIVKLDILLNGELVDAFSCLIHSDRAEYKGRQMCKSLKEIIHPHLFAIPVQAVIGKKVLARETIRALRKDVTAKCYGGDITRKRKLLERQKEGKKKMKEFGSVRVPPEAFMSVLRSRS